MSPPPTPIVGDLLLQAVTNSATLGDTPIGNVPHPTAYASTKLIRVRL
jgi:hypothetical protein